VTGDAEPVIRFTPQVRAHYLRRGELSEALDSAARKYRKAAEKLDAHDAKLRELRAAVWLSSSSAGTELLWRLDSLAWAEQERTPLTEAVTKRAEKVRAAALALDAHDANAPDEQKPRP
jgi:hypothetical protein